MSVDLNHPSPVRISSDIPLLRYMDVGKFYDLLATEELHFVRLDLLRVVDPREGRLPDIVRREMKDLRAMSVAEIESDSRFPRDSAKSLKDIAEHMFEHLEGFAATTFVHCWHAGNSESMAMWNSYAGRGAGVAISSSVGALCGSLATCGREMIGGAVKYIDPNAAAAEIGNTYNAVYRKHECFEFEREFRLAFSTFGEEGVGTNLFSGTPDTRQGVRIVVRPRDFISQITPSPNLPDREIRLVEKLSSDFGLADLFQKSKISFDPDA